MKKNYKSVLCKLKDTYMALNKENNVLVVPNIELRKQNR